MKTILLASCLALACATAAPREGTPPGAARIPTATDERIAAQRASDPKVDRAAEERRWGSEEARQRAADTKAKREAALRQSTPGVDVKQAKPPK